jgi:hypothetical protein
MWWPFKRTAEKRLIQSFETGLRLIQVSLFTRLRSQYLATMDEEAAATLAAQVVNYLKGDDIASVMLASPEPLKSRIVRIKDQVSTNAARALAESRSTREVIVATLRMREVVEFMLQGDPYLHTDQHRRIYNLLSAHVPEFPEEVKPERYMKMAERYRQEQFGTSTEATGGDH